MSSESIARLREQFEAELKQNASLYHPIDIERVRSEDWQVKRYLLEYDDESKAFASLCKTLQWKHSFGIHTRTDQDFPYEFWPMSGSEFTGIDKHGRFIYWETARNQRNFKETALLARQFVAHCLEKTDRGSGETGCIFVGDTNGASIFNIDNDMERFKIELMDHYPQVVKAMYIVDVPWLLNAIIRLILSWMNPKLRALVHFVSAEQLQDTIDIELIPVAMKGKREPIELPKNLLPMDQLYSKLGLDEKFVKHFYKTCKFTRSNN